MPLVEGASLEWVELVAALLVILAGAWFFTNGVEWIGESLGLSEGAVGSVLAAVGTALPETVLPVVAILTGHKGGHDIGIGATGGARIGDATALSFLLSAATLIVIFIQFAVARRREDR